MSNLGYLKVSAISPEVVVANATKNVKAAVESVKKAVDDGCQIICLPELFLTSSTCGDLFKNETLIKKSEQALGVLLNETKKFDSVIIIGAPIKSGYRLFDCGVVMCRGEILGVVPKIHTQNSRYFSCGEGCEIDEITVLEKNVPFGQLLFKGGNTVFGVEIGDDKNAPISPSMKMALSGANVIFNPCTDVLVLGSEEYNEKNINAISSKCMCAYVSASSGVGESSTDLVFSGNCVISESGEVLSGKTIDIDKINAVRLREKFGDFCKNNEYKTIKFDLPKISKSDIDSKYDKHPFVHGEEKCEKALNIQCSALKKRMTHVGIKKLVLGISGGLDSTLALLVAHKTIKDLALPSENIICITMPGFGTTDTTYNNAVNLIKALGAEFREIDIKNASLQHMSDIGHDVNIHDITYENTQARERTQILMDIANKENALLMGTGDLSEAALGWCTYNGDHMSMYNVNCGVPKTFIRCIVDFVANRSDENVKVLLKNILNTPVSPELLPPDEQGKIQQKTEDTLGPYEVHDFLLYHFISYGYSKEKLSFILKETFSDEYNDEQLEKWLNTFLRRFFINQFKRSCVPDGPKVFAVGLSPRSDWQMPSDADFSEWMM